MSDGALGEYYEVQPLSGHLRLAVTIGVVLVVAAGVVLRFWTSSALWLDEALTVNIARLPLHEIPGRLKQDGAPPLYYYLLHFWMRLFGTSDLATRSLSGIVSVLTLPVAWWATKRFGGRSAPWVIVVLLASAPFAIFYATEARMYALVMLLTGCGIVALQGALSKPRAGNLITVGVVTAALLYTQYWSLYLVGVVGLWLIITAGQARHRSPDTAEWRQPVPALLAITAGCVAFVPWFPTFLYQSAHTGTPWAAPANFGGVVDAVTGFTYNQASLSPVASNQGRLLILIYLVLAALGLFGVGRTGRTVELDLHTRPRTRGISFVVIGTLFAAIAGGLITTSAFSARYASVVFLPFLVVVALGSSTLLNAKGRAILVAVAAAAGLILAVQSQDTQRTQAPRVAAVLAAHAQPGDIIAFCPDQLGPDTYRAVKDPAQYRMITFPRGIGPQFVDWVDYAKASRRAHATTFAAGLERTAGSDHHIWLVWQPGYQTFGAKCENLAALLGDVPGVTQRDWVGSNPATYYEPMNLTEYSLTGR